MIEATTNPQTQAAFEAAHAARGEAVRALFTTLRNLFQRKSPTPAPAALAH